MVRTIRALALLGVALLAESAALAEAPTLVQQGSATQLVVGGKPMLVLGGELSNSASSSAEYMAPHWAKLRAMHVNTVLAPVAWELIEPREGVFDWTSVDALIRDARAHDLKLVFLWFGAWKNSMSTYAPAWVKRDQARFPRAQLADGRGVDILSAFAPATLEADSRAYAALMAHLRTVDAVRNTVVMVQVENEIGMLPVARDHGPLAEAAWRQPVPADLVAYLTAHRATLVPGMQRMWVERGAKTAGSWEDLFGRGDAGAEVFTAWHYARFADRLTAAGKAAYALPMYVNVALNRPGRAPGEYPSGGPLPHLLDVWKAGGPTIDLIAPDIYFANFVDLVDRYKRPDNPLFIPEANNADLPSGPANAFYAIGAHDSIGYSPFAIDQVDDAPGPLAGAYDVLRQLTPSILAAQGRGRMVGFKPHELYDGTVLYEPQTLDLGGYRFTIAYADIQKPTLAPTTAASGGIIIEVAPEEFLIAGQGITVTFAPIGDGPGQAGLDSVYEGSFDAAGAWKPVRLLNGDQTHQGRHVSLPTGTWQIQRVKLYRYE
jgi:beta-galactosidase GanA